MQNQPYYAPQPKEPGISSGFKFVLGGCLAIVLLAGGACVACAVLFSGASQIANRNSPAISKPAPQGNQITLDKFNRLYDGESYSDVCITLGETGKLSTSSGTGKYKMEIYTWDAGFMKSVSVSFQNGKLTAKSQIGLE